MSKEKVIIWIWGCLVAVFGIFYAGNLFYIMLYKWVNPDGTLSISFDGAGFAQFILVCAVYYTTKTILLSETKQWMEK